MKQDEVLISSSEAAAILNVHESSIRRWNNEGVLIAEHTFGKHRKLLFNDVMKFASEKTLSCEYLKFQSDPGIVYSFIKDFCKKGNYKEVARYAYELYSEKKLSDLSLLVDLIFANNQLTLGDIFDNFLKSLFTHVGIKWAVGDIKVADEHIISSIVDDCLARRIYNIQTPVDSNKTAVLACIEGNYHTTGLRICQLALKQAGWNVIYCGANTPLADLYSITENFNASKLVLSLSKPQSISDVIRSVGLLKKYYKDKRNFEIHIGGNAISDDELREYKPGLPIKIHNSLLTFQESIQ